MSPGAPGKGKNKVRAAGGSSFSFFTKCACRRVGDGKAYDLFLRTREPAPPARETAAERRKAYVKVPVASLM